jgi:hypothetical protein
VGQFYTHDAILKGEHTRVHAPTASRPGIGHNEMQAKLAAGRTLGGVIMPGSSPSIARIKIGSRF